MHLSIITVLLLFHTKRGVASEGKKVDCWLTGILWSGGREMSWRICIMTNILYSFCKYYDNEVKGNEGGEARHVEHRKNRKCIVCYWKILFRQPERKISLIKSNVNMRYKENGPLRYTAWECGPDWAGSGWMSEAGCYEHFGVP